MDLTIRPVTLERWAALEDLFGAAGASSGCWCMYWRIGPRYRQRPREDNKSDLRALAAAGPPPGLLAFAGGVPAGWCELAPRAGLGWLAHARYLQPADDLPVWSVPCFYVRRTHRGQGVMDALIGCALAPRRAPRRWRRTRSTPRCQGTPATCSPGRYRPSPATAFGSWPGASPTARSCGGPSAPRRDRVPVPSAPVGRGD